MPVEEITVAGVDSKFKKNTVKSAIFVEREEPKILIVLPANPELDEREVT